MKQHFYISAICGILLLPVAMNAQGFTGTYTMKYIRPMMLEITQNKTTVLVFPAAIASVDRGTPDILVRKAGGTENVLEVKAARKNMAETNLHVLTLDGKWFAFTVDYQAQPAHLDICVSQSNRVADTSGMQPVIQHHIRKESSPAATLGEMARYAAITAQQKREITGISDKRYKMKFQLYGIYIYDDVLYLQLNLSDKSHIGYDLDRISFTLRNRIRMKRTAAQELPLSPIFVPGNQGYIQADHGSILVYALPVFTVPDGKYLEIEAWESGGSRNLVLSVKGRIILDARNLPQQGIVKGQLKGDRGS
ncbi:MAG TPA: conjugative transposon protein TraN [Chitinophagaceae bacterium]|nr:conjugative transposon protein TraN [Chitinophagaceae bacterium]